MPMYWKRKVIAAKSESVYGTDAGPTAAANAVLARNVSLRPLEMLYDEREIDTGFLGHKGELIAGQFVQMEFEVEMAGAGAAGTAPGYGPLLKGCGCAETINAGVSVVYAPVNPGSETSFDVYFWMGGRRHKITGAIANFEAVLPRGRVPFIKFSITGLYTLPDDNALPAPTLTAYQKPLPVTNTNTTPATLYTFSGKFSEIRFASGNVLPYRNLVGSEAVRLVDRKSTGSVKLEDELIATKDWYTIMKAGTTGALSVTHGTAAGNKVTLAAPNVQLTRPAMDQDDSISMLSMNMILQPSSAGNDEWSITVL